MNTLRGENKAESLCWQQHHEAVMPVQVEVSLCVLAEQVITEQGCCYYSKQGPTRSRRFESLGLPQ